MDDQTWAQMVRDEHERRRSMEAKMPRERDDAAVLGALESMRSMRDFDGGGETVKMSRASWQETLERAIGPMAWGLTPEDLTPHGIGRMRARAATPEDTLLAVLVAGLHVRRAR